MKRLSYHVLHIGLGITFLWIGVLILKNPVAWVSYIQPWAAKLLPGPLTQAMIGTGILDIVIGVMLLLNIFPFIASLVGAIHLVMVLIVSGITDITVRDIGLLYCAAALSIETVPEFIASRFSFLR